MTSTVVGEVVSGPMFAVPVEFVGRGVNKNPYLNPPNKNSPSVPVELARISGSFFHIGQQKANEGLSGLSEDEIEKWITERYADVPPVYQAWVRQSIGAAPGINALQKVPEGRSSTKLHEVKMSLGRTGLKAARTIRAALLVEKRRTDGMDGPLANLVRVSKTFLDPDVSDGRFDGALAQLGEFMLSEDEVLSEDEIRQLFEDAGTHLKSYGGNVVMCPVGRPDVIDLDHDERDAEAKYATASFAAVLRQGVGIDPQKLAEIRVPYGEGDTLATISGVEAVRQAADRMLSGQIVFTVRDYKTLSHIGKRYEHTDRLWEAYDGDLARIFSDENLDQDGPDGPEYDQIREMWHDMQYDIAKTNFVIRNFFRVAEIAYHSAFPDASFIDLNTLMSLVKSEVIIVDFDISNGQEGSDKKSEEAPAGQAIVQGATVEPKPDIAKKYSLKYETSPPIEQAGRPKEVRYALKAVPEINVRQNMENWASRVYKLSRRAGQLAIEAAEFGQPGA